MKFIKNIYKGMTAWIVYLLVRYLVPGNKHLMIKWTELKLNLITQEEFQMWMQEEAKKING